MVDEFQIAYVEKPEESAWGIIGRGLGAFNKEIAGGDNFQRLCFALVDPDQKIVGGVLGELFWNWLHVELLWVPEELRGRGFGDRLLATIEDEARQRGAKNAFLDTFSFQAPDFYQQRGYRVFGELDDFPAGHSRYFFTKPL